MTIFKKNLLALGLAALGFSTALLVLVLVFMNSLYYEINAVGLSNTAKALITAIGEDRITEIFTANAVAPGTEITLPISAGGVYRLTLITPDGEVLWDSHITGGLVNHLNREEIRTALEDREGITWRTSVSTGMKQIYCALPVFGRNNQIIGVLRLSITVPKFGARISPIILPLLISAGLLAITAFWIIFSFSRSLSISLARLVNIAQTGASLLSDPEAVQSAAVDFESMERVLRALIGELNFRFEQAMSEGSRLEAILNGMSDAVFAMDSSLILHLVNPRARELFNLGNRDIAGLSLLEATRSTELEEAAKKVLSGGDPLEMEITFHAGTEQYFQVFAAPLAGREPRFSEAANAATHPTNGSGANAVGVVLVLQEITRLIRLERIRKDFVANVSHELRTPIQLIKGFSETLMDSASVSDTKNDKEKEQIIHFIEIIHKNAGIMENLTNDLLILAGLENGGVKVYDIKEQDIAALINEAVSSVEPQAKRKQTEIIVSCPDGLKANLYGSFIIQALINLIDNGIKYSPPASKLWISACLTNGQAYQEEAQPSGSGELVLEVRDKGIGISGEYLERIFERFYRVDRARSREAGGTGLGLSIVRHIALLHGGKAEVESHVGEGSIFRLIIPEQIPQK